MHATAENFGNVHGELLSKIIIKNTRLPSFGDILLRLPSLEIIGPGGSVRLSSYEYRILWLLVRAQGTVITVDEIMYFIYDDSDKDLPLGNSTQVLISRVRKKIKGVQSMVRIEVFRGFGYLLE